MDKSAIKQIQESQTVEHINEFLSNCEAESPVVVIPDNMALKSLEEHMVNAARFRLDFKTSSIDDFIDYSKGMDSSAAMCFVDAKNMRADAIYDLGTVVNPLHKENKACLTLKKSPEFEDLMLLTSRQKTQKESGEFVEDWNDLIEVISSKNEKMQNSTAINSFYNMTIESARKITSVVSDFGGKLSAMEEIEAKSESGLPAFIGFKCKPFTDLSEKTFKLRISIITGGDKLMFKFRILQLDSIMDSYAKEFKELIKTKMEGFSTQVYTGTV